MFPYSYDQDAEDDKTLGPAVRDDKGQPVKAAPGAGKRAAPGLPMCEDPSIRERMKKIAEEEKRPPLDEGVKE